MRLRLLHRFVPLLALFLALSPFARAASDWKVIKVGIWDYVSLDNFAKFYSLPATVLSGGKTFRLDNGTNAVEVTLFSREAKINGVRNWLSWPVIEKDGQPLIHRIDLAKTFEPQLRPHLIHNLGKVQTVVLDPGHGGHDKGATNMLGCEKDYTLDVARQLKPLLEAKGLRVVMTRDSDVFVPLEERARIANATRDCVFVSIHFNATDFNPGAAGFEIYSLTPRGAPSSQDDSLALHFPNMQAGSPVDAPSLALSTSIYHSVVGHIPEFDRGIKRARFAVLRLTKVPAVLVEGGFVTERGESRLIADSAWRARLAQSISTGIDNYKTLVETKRRPMMVADYRRQLGGELIARDAMQPAPGTIGDPSLIMPASNDGVMSTRHSMQPASEASEFEPETVMDAPPTGPLVVTNENGAAAVEQPTAPVAVAPPAPTDNPPVIAPDPAPRADLPVAGPASETQLVNAAIPSPKRVWWLGPFPKFQP